MYRLFFAAWPEPDVREDILVVVEQWRSQLLVPAKFVDSSRLHMTLYFLGGVADRQALDALIDRAEHICLPDFGMQLNRLGCFRTGRRQTAWLGPRQQPNDLVRLHDELALCCRKYSLPQGERSFLPHVSVFRASKCAEPPQIDYAIDWRVQEFVLVNSRLSAAGPEYEILHRFPLRDRATMGLAD